MKNIMLVAVALVIACAVAGLVIIKRQAVNEVPAAKAPRPAEPARTVHNTLPAAPPEEAPPALAEVVAPAPAPPAPPPDSVRTEAKHATATAQASQGGRPAKEPLQDPLAQEVLPFVGADPMANEYWYAAINDPNLPAHERQDLIEDLNEDGLSDPKHPGPEDLPLILSRIQLIEETGPYAMDKVNADAFPEAYKDLLNLASLALGGGEPVR